MKPPAKFSEIKHCLFIINNEDKARAVHESLRLIRYVIDVSTGGLNVGTPDSHTLMRFRRRRSQLCFLAGVFRPSVSGLVVFVYVVGHPTIG